MNHPACMTVSDLILTPAWACRKCGACERYANGQCKACSRACAAAWKAKNPEKKKASSSDWYAANRERNKASKVAWNSANPGRQKIMDAARYAANPEKSKVNSAAWRAANQDRHKQNKAAWGKANPEAVRVHSQNRRARKIESGGALSKGLAEKLFKLQKGKCPCCKQPLGDDYHMDHKMPLALGGSNTDDNMQLLRAVCNMQKSAKHPVEFMQSRGFLL